MNLCEVEACLVYRESSSTVFKAIEKPCTKKMRLLLMPGSVVHAFNPSTLEVDADGKEKRKKKCVYICSSWRCLCF